MEDPSKGSRNTVISLYTLNILLTCVGYISGVFAFFVTSIVFMIFLQTILSILGLGLSSNGTSDIATRPETKPKNVADSD
jgi:hypothetical protein